MPETPRIRKQTMIHLEPPEVLSVLRAAKAKGAREWAMIVVAYKHAMRASEVCNLRVDDIDLKNGSIVVERLKGSLRTRQAVTEHRGEPLLNELKALREWLPDVKKTTSILAKKDKGTPQRGTPRPARPDRGGGHPGRPDRAFENDLPGEPIVPDRDDAEMPGEIIVPDRDESKA